VDSPFFNCKPLGACISIDSCVSLKRDNKYRPCKKCDPTELHKDVVDIRLHLIENPSQRNAQPILAKHNVDYSLYTPNRIHDR
jgi:methylphosphotriester-DNA--protein-cysteine methyltransferase